MALHLFCSFCSLLKILPLSPFLVPFTKDASVACWQRSHLLGRVWDEGFGGQWCGGFHGLMEACG